MSLFVSSVFSRKCNKTDESLYLLERCIKLEPRFVPAYLELVKLYRGWSAGRILDRVVEINPRNADLRVQYGDWLYEHRKYLYITFSHT